MTIKALIFDVGSVLVRMVDETPRLQLAERYNLPLIDVYHAIFDSPTAFPACVGQLTIEQHWEAVFTELPIPAPEKEAFIRQFWAADGLNTELVEAIRTLRQNYKLGLLSNAWSDLRANLTHRWQIADLFEVLIISAEVGLAKPDPAIYQLALERLAVAPQEAVFIDDVLENIESAQSVGLLTVHYQDNLQLFAELQELLQPPS